MNRKWFEYHCNESHSSQHAEWWYRSHSRIKVLKIVEKGIGRTLKERGENGSPRVYKVRFDDGWEADVFEDEVLRSRKEFSRPAPPIRPRLIG